MLKGKAWKYGDNVDTDVIIPARYLTSSDPEVLKAHALADLDPGFAGKVGPGDVLVAGANFGCGSSREHAPLAIKAAGVSCVVAKSFGRIFFRNSFNIGLPILESAAAAEGIEAGDELEIDLAAGRIQNLTKNAEYAAHPIPDFMQELIADGGLLGHVKKLIGEGRLAMAPAEETPAPVEKKKRGERAQAVMDEKKPAGRDAPWEQGESAPADSGQPVDADEEGEEEEGAE